MEHIPELAPCPYCGGPAKVEDLRVCYGATCESETDARCSAVILHVYSDWVRVEWNKYANACAGAERDALKARVAELEELHKEDERRHQENKAFIDERVEVWRRTEHELRRDLIFAQASADRWAKAVLKLIEGD